MRTPPGLPLECGGPAHHPARAYPRRNLTDPRTYITGRQRQILALAANGNTNRATGRALGISEESVKSHMQLILRKLRVHDRTQAVAVALAMGVLDLEDISVPEGANRGYRDAV
ncbi:helix-turn-helix transcriptional regulator [Streptomyces sp. NPDC006551]|uniref:helix-turn-helix domain-containing protein n=1 Tax=Streptomyces sp. NPDC006551 TaxID=3157178 RepID=UPI0033B32FA9